MNLSYVRTSLLSALIGHVGGLLVLLLIGYVGWKSSDPRTLVLWLGVGALIAGAIFCGMIVRRRRIGLYGALLSVVFYLLPVVIGWIFGNSSISLTIRLGIAAGCAGLILSLSLILPSGVGRIQSGRKMHKSAVRKYRRIH